MPARAAAGPVGDAGGSGVLDQSGDVGQEAGGALVDAVQELVREGGFVVGRRPQKTFDTR